MDKTDKGKLIENIDIQIKILKQKKTDLKKTFQQRFMNFQNPNPNHDISRKQICLFILLLAFRKENPIYIKIDPNKDINDHDLTAETVNTIFINYINNPNSKSFLSTNVESSNNNNTISTNSGGSNDANNNIIVMNLQKEINKNLNDLINNTNAKRSNSISNTTTNKSPKYELLKESVVINVFHLKFVENIKNMYNEIYKTIDEITKTKINIDETILTPEGKNNLSFFHYVVYYLDYTFKNINTIDVHETETITDVLVKEKERIDKLSQASQTT